MNPTFDILIIMAAIAILNSKGREPAIDYLMLNGRDQKESEAVIDLYEAYVAMITANAGGDLPRF